MDCDKCALLNRHETYNWCKYFREKITESCGAPLLATVLGQNPHGLSLIIKPRYAAIYWGQQPLAEAYGEDATSQLQTRLMALAIDLITQEHYSF